MGIIERLQRSRERRRVERELAELEEYAPYTPALAGGVPPRRQNRPALERVVVAAVVSVVALSPIFGSALYLGSMVEEREAETKAAAALDSAQRTYTAALQADYEARGKTMPEPGRVISGQADYEPTTEAAAEAHEDVIAAEARLEVLEEDPSPITTIGRRVTGAYR